jgi:predicted dehydrogenase
VSNKARLASIGVGMIGAVHARSLPTEELCEYVAICDPDPSKKAIADKCGVPFYSDYKEMIAKEKLDGVVIAVPNDDHITVGTYCADHGLHILMEKPIAPTVADAEQIVEAADRNEVQLAVGHHRRFNPLMVAMKGILERQELGKIVGISMLWAMYKPAEYFVQGPWRAKPGGGPILINLIHEIDNLRYLYGEIASVYAEVSNAARGFEVEDTIGLTIRLKDGAIANILLSDTVPSIWAYEATMGEFDHFEPGGGNIYHFFGDKGSLAFPEMLEVSYPEDGHWGWQDPFTREHLDLKSANPYPDQIHSFCNVVLGNETPRTTGRDALQSLKVAMAVGESGRTHRPITFDV